MNKALKISLIILSTVIAAGVAFFIYVSNKLEGLQETSVDKDYALFFDDTKDTVFIKASSWGLTGDHIQIQLSTSPIINRKYDSTKNYIFYEPTIYCQQKNDTLIIYTPTMSDLPVWKDAHIKIIQVQLDDPAEVKKYEENYKKLGLQKMSIYN